MKSHYFKGKKQNIVSSETFFIQGFGVGSGVLGFNLRPSPKLKLDRHSQNSQVGVMFSYHLCCWGYNLDLLFSQSSAFHTIFFSLWAISHYLALEKRTGLGLSFWWDRILMRNTWEHHEPWTLIVHFSGETFQSSNPAIFGRLRGMREAPTQGNGRLDAESIWHAVPSACQVRSTCVKNQCDSWCVTDCVSLRGSFWQRYARSAGLPERKSLPKTRDSLDAQKFGKL